MLRILALAAALTALLVADASAACRDGASVDDRSGPGLRAPTETVVVVCRDGRERVVRRATQTRTRGTLYTSAALVGNRLALARVVRHGRRRHTLVAELRAWPSDRLRFRRTKTIRAENDEPQVALSARGSFAWAFDRRLAARTADGRVVLVTASGGYRPFFDEDETLLWYGATRPRDLRPLPLDADRCPVRTRFAPILDTPTVRVTYRDYGAGLTERNGEPDHIRACIKGSGTDRVVAAGGGDDSDSTFPKVVAATAPFVLATVTSANKYDGCAGVELRVVDVRTGKLARRSTITGQATPTEPGCTYDPLVPRAEDPSVVTAGGAPAWVRDGVLRALDGQGTLVELDRGTVTDLTADGTIVRWRRDGVDRSAAL